MLGRVRRRVRQSTPRWVKSFVWERVWPVLRWRIPHRVLVRTYYPGCWVRIMNEAGRWELDVTNGAPDKITSEEIARFFGDVLRERLPRETRLVCSLCIDLLAHSVCLESWRDICTGRIDRLIEDDSVAFEHARIGAFGYLMGVTKPERLRFIDYAARHPERFEYIETQKFTPRMTKRLSLLEYKRRFKYVIDLPGHTYSTKSYWMLFLKRPLFYVEPVVKMAWERRLVPWRHYIPVRDDLSDLVERYEWAESHPDEVAAIADHLYEFGLHEMSPEQVLARFVHDVEQCLGPLDSAEGAAE